MVDPTGTGDEELKLRLCLVKGKRSRSDFSFLVAGKGREGFPLLESRSNDDGLSWGF